MMTETPQKAFKKNASPVESAFHFFLDLDGVLADFDSHAQNTNLRTPEGKIPYNTLDEKWWVTMPAFAGAKSFFDDVRKLGTTKFLTAPMLSAGCFSGKAKWVQGFVPESGRFILKDLIICPSDNKSYLARPNHILVDDRQKNIDEWVAAGGIGVLHTSDFADTMQRMKQAMTDYSAKKANKPRAQRKKTCQKPPQK